MVTMCVICIHCHDAIPNEPEPKIIYQDGYRIARTVSQAVYAPELFPGAPRPMHQKCLVAMDCDCC